jgi:hypothetical protein
MRTQHFAAVTMAAVLGLATAMLPGDANARAGGGGGHGGGGGGHSGGARASFGGGSFSSGARASFSGGGGVRFSAPARSTVAFVGVTPRQQSHGFVSGGQRAHHGRRGHRGGGYYGTYGDTYAYGTFISGRSYNSCGWLKARYEDTGNHKWRKRYYECLNGDDD